MSSSIKAVAVKACRHFMVPIARFLLGVGVGYREFAEISKLAFVQVASDEYGIRGRKTNMSRVSVMTGLNRKEIRKIRGRLQDEDWSLDPELSKPSSVLTKWFTDPHYVGPRGSPKWLPYEEESSKRSFVQLVKEVSGDLPPGAMLKELVRAGCVREVRPGVWKAIKRQYSPAGIDLFQVQRFGECLHDLAETITKNYTTNAFGGERLFEFRAWADGVQERATPELRKIVSSQGEAYLESVDDWLGAHLISSEHSGDSASGIRCGVGVYYFETREKQEFADVGS
jgi:hypothetical protein